MAFLTRCLSLSLLAVCSCVRTLLSSGKPMKLSSHVLTLILPVRFLCRVYAMYNSVKGSCSEPVSFTTHSCAPECPFPPKLAHRSRSSLTLQWKVSKMPRTCSARWEQSGAVSDSPLARGLRFLCNHHMNQLGCIRNGHLHGSQRQRRWRKDLGRCPGASWWYKYLRFITLLLEFMSAVIWKLQHAV